MKKKSAGPMVIVRQQTGIHETADHFQALLTNLRYEGKPRVGDNIRKIVLTLDSMEDKAGRQFQLEGEKVFPFLAKHAPALGPAIHLLAAEHVEFQNRAKQFRKELGRFSKVGPDSGKTFEKLNETGIYLVYLIRHHLQAGNCLYKATSGNLRAGERAELKDLIAERENHEHAKKRSPRTHR